LASPTVTPEWPDFYPEFPLRALASRQWPRIRPRGNQQGQETAVQRVGAHGEPQDFAERDAARNETHRSRNGHLHQPSLTQKNLRLIEIRACANTPKGHPHRVFATRERMRAAERELARQAETAYRRTVADRQNTPAKKKGAGATPGRASHGPSNGQAARQVQAPGPAP
jgi:hypothetical protein